MSRPDPALDLGVAALEDGARVDFARLRRGRRERLLAALRRDEIDVLVCGRDADLRYATGARRLWTAGLRPFGPAALVVAATGAVHLAALWDDGVPPELPPERWIPMAWDPATLLRSLAAVPGLSEARRVAVDGLSPRAARLLLRAAPKAELVDGALPLLEARRRKTPEELRCIRTAVALAEAALCETLHALHPGLPECAASGRFAEAASRLGCPLPACPPTFCAVPADGAAPRQRASGRPLGEGERVAAQVGLLYAGYEGALARTWPVPAQRPLRPPERDLLQRWRDRYAPLAEACRPGAAAGDVWRAHAAHVGGPPGLPILRGVGLGTEPPVLRSGPGNPVEVLESPLEEGMVVALQVFAGAEGAGGVLASETLLLHATGHETLTRLAHTPQP